MENLHDLMQYLTRGDTSRLKFQFRLSDPSGIDTRSIHVDFLSGVLHPAHELWKKAKEVRVHLEVHPIHLNGYAHILVSLIKQLCTGY